MKLCLLTEYFNPGGAGGTPSMLPVLAQQLLCDHPEFSIDVVTSRNVYRGADERLPGYEEWEGMRVFRLQMPRSNQHSTAMRMAAGAAFSLAATAKVCALPRYDLLLVGTNPPAAPLAGELLRRLRGTPYVYLIHDLFPDVGVALRTLAPQHPVTRLGARLQRGWLHGAARVVVIGRCMRDHLVQTYALPSTRIDVIPNWADPAEIKPLPRETAFRRTHGLTGFVLLYAGNFGQYQDFDTLLNAAQQLAARHPEITLVLVGDGARKEYLAQRIAGEALTNVKMFPFVPKAAFPDLLASADAALVTLEPGAEGVGVPSKFYTILAAGRPVIATVAPTSEVALVLEEAGCGVRVNQGDMDGLVAAVQRLVEEPALAVRMGQRARAVLEAQFTLAATADRFYRTFCLVTGKPLSDESTNSLV